MLSAALTVSEFAAAAGLDVLAPGDTDLPVRDCVALDPGTESPLVLRHRAVVISAATLQSADHPPERLIAELGTYRVSAVVVPAVAAGLAAELVSAARRASLSLLTSQAHHSAADVHARAARAIEAFRLRREHDLQNALLDALGDDEPIAAMVRQLSRAMSGVAVLYDNSGHVVASGGRAPTERIWSAIRSGRTRGGSAAAIVGRWHIQSRPLQVHGVAYWITVGAAEQETLDDLAPTLLATTQRLLTAMRGLRVLQVAQSTAHVAQLFSDLEAGVSSQETRFVWDRLGKFGFAFQTPLRTIVGQSIGEHHRALSDRLLTTAQQFNLPVIFEIDSATAAFRGLVAEGTILDDWLREIAESYAIGLGGTFHDLTQFGIALREAHSAVRVAVQRAYRRAGLPAKRLAHDRIVRFEEVDMVEWLLAGREPEAVAARARQQLADIAERDDLCETLAAYLACDMDVALTSEFLYLHPNSIRYRLRRAEHALGSGLTSTALVANLYLAFHDRIADITRARLGGALGDSP